MVLIDNVKRLSFLTIYGLYQSIAESNVFIISPIFVGTSWYQAINRIIGPPGLLRPVSFPPSFLVQDYCRTLRASSGLRSPSASQSL